MLLNLSIELTEALGRTFDVSISRNGILLAGYEFDVGERDCVVITATGKGESGTEVSESGEIVADISLVLKSMTLGGVDFDPSGLVDACDLDGNPLNSNASLYTDGTITISIDKLLQSHYNYKNAAILTLEQVALEVLGRPSSLKL